MPLSDVAIRSAKPGPKPIKLSDEKGLFLLVQPSGGKLWRLKYRFGGKEKKLSLGRYPDVGLKEARERCSEARKLIAAGIDPSEQKQGDRINAEIKSATTFKAVANEYILKCEREGLAAVTIGKSRWLLSLFDAAMAERPIEDIRPGDLLSALKKVEARGHLETARRMRSVSSRVFRYAVATDRASADPSALLRGALVAPKATHHAAILDEKGVGALMRAIDGYDGQPMTQLALDWLRMSSFAPVSFGKPSGRRSTSKPEFGRSPHRR